MSLVNVFRETVKKLESIKLPAFPGYMLAVAFFVLSFYSPFKYGVGVFYMLFVYAGILAVIFTKKSRFYGAHLARIASVASFYVVDRLLYPLFPVTGSKWYGDCLITDDGSLEVVTFISFFVAYISYFLTKHFVCKNSPVYKNSETGSSDFNVDCKHNTCNSKSKLAKFVYSVDKFHLPRNFALGLFILCVLGHLAFGFCNAHIYNACKEYNRVNGINGFVGDIYSWHIMDALLFYICILIGIFSLKAKYFGANFVRIFTFFAFFVLNIKFGYFYNLNLQEIGIVLGFTIFAYFVSRFAFLRLITKNNGIYGA